MRLIVSVFFLSILPAQVYALTPGQVFDKVKDAVVVVKTLDTQGKPKAQGSGVLLPTGKIATNCHVVEGGTSYLVGRGNQLIPATLFAEDGDKDICLLDAKGITGKPAQLGKAADLKVGDPVYAVGAPRGLELSLSDGIVAQLRGGPPPFIQTTAAISPGSSGGGLFDSEGRLVGLTTLYIEGGQNLNFAMPVEWIGEVKPGRKMVAGSRSQTEWVKRAIALENMKDWQVLLDWCLKWTKNEPKNVSAWFFLGVAYDELNHYNEAIEACRQAIRINPEIADVWFFLGLVYRNLKRPNDTIKAFRQVIRINSENALAWFGLGMAYYNLKRYDDAVEAYRQALRINPEYAGVWDDLGMAYYNLKRYDDAIGAFRQAIGIDPKNTDPWIGLGLAYANSGNKTAALDAVRELRHLDPKQADKLFNLIVPR